MHLSIPVLDLLQSQLDIALNPLSGKMTYDIKDIPSRLRQCYRSLHLRDLVLTLHSSSGETCPLTLCIRLSSAQGTVSAQGSVDMFEVSSFHNSIHGDLFDLSEESPLSLVTGPALCDSSTFVNVDNPSIAYHRACTGQGSVETIINLESGVLAPFREEISQQSNESPMSPASQTLSTISSGSIINDLAIYSPSCVYAFNGFPYDAHCAQGTAAYQFSHNPLSDSDMMDNQAQIQVSRSSSDSRFGGALPIMDLFTPPLHSEPPTAVVSPTHNQITLESSTSAPLHASSDHEQRTTPTPPNRSDPPIKPAPRTKRSECYPCPYPSCTRVLKSLYTQQVHLKTHEAKPQKNFPCTMGCSESFTRHHDRLRHEVAQHGKKCEFSCGRCERFFSSQRMLDRHTCWSWRNGSLRWQLKDVADMSRSDT